MFEIRNCPVGVYMIFDSVCTDYSYNFCHLKRTKYRVAFEGQNSFQVIDLLINALFWENVIVDLFVELIDRSGTRTFIC